jgi:hypothetical protein
VAGMHQRKAEMARNSDAFIALPGTPALPCLFDHPQSLDRTCTLAATSIIEPSHGLILAGGYGTLDELLEVIAWAQLGIHSKPVSADNDTIPGTHTHTATATACPGWTRRQCNCTLHASARQGQPALL